MLVSTHKCLLNWAKHNRPALVNLHSTSQVDWIPPRFQPRSDSRPLDGFAVAHPWLAAFPSFTLGCPPWGASHYPPGCHLFTPFFFFFFSSSIPTEKTKHLAWYSDYQEGGTGRSHRPFPLVKTGNPLSAPFEMALEAQLNFRSWTFQSCPCI